MNEGTKNRIFFLWSKVKEAMQDFQIGMNLVANGYWWSESKNKWVKHETDQQPTNQ